MILVNGQDRIDPEVAAYAMKCLPPEKVKECLPGIQRNVELIIERWVSKMDRCAQSSQRLSTVKGFQKVKSVSGYT